MIIWIILGISFLFVLGAAAFLVGFHLYLMRTYIPRLVRIFTEKPIFIIPFGQPLTDAEEVSFATTDNLTLRGCYLGGAGPRKGVILFGLEFGSNRWSCASYCEFLRANGYDIFTFEMRGQGDSPVQAGYEPNHWVTEFEVQDYKAALAYLKGRGDAEAGEAEAGSAERGGIGFFGLSKGGSAGLIAAAQDPAVRCCVTDGAFATFTTMVPYMQKWILIYSNRHALARLIPTWYYRYAARVGLERIAAQNHCRFPHLEDFLPQLAPRPLLMIHGSADNYIMPEMAQALFAVAGPPKEFWLVEGAKHNQSLNQAGDDYQRRILEFFDEHLAGKKKEPVGLNGVYAGEQPKEVNAL